MEMSLAVIGLVEPDLDTMVSFDERNTLLSES